MNSEGNSKVTKEKTILHKCALCPFSSKFLDNYKKHLKCHSDEKPFKCPECSFKTKWKGDVKNHLENVHIIQSPSSRPFPCPESGCNYAAKRKNRLNVHLKIHCAEKSFVCSHSNCNYSTNDKHHLVRPTRCHSGEKPFVCQFESCSYATAHKSQLVAHSRTHTKERPYKCPEPNCEYSASQNFNLKQHRLTHHSKEGEELPLFSCPLCEYSTKIKGYLTEHIKQRHTLEKLFKCDEPNCNFEAKTKKHIKGHKLVHSDEKPFACSFGSCEYRCKYKSNLSVHLKSHSDERRYKCELCPFRGKQRAAVLNHLRRLHFDSDSRPVKPVELKCNLPEKCGFKTSSHAKLAAHFNSVHSFPRVLLQQNRHKK